MLLLLSILELFSQIYWSVNKVWKACNFEQFDQSVCQLLFYDGRDQCHLSLKRKSKSRKNVKALMHTDFGAGILCKIKVSGSVNVSIFEVICVLNSSSAFS